MAITSGVRQIVAQAVINGAYVPVEKADVSQSATREAASWFCEIAWNSLPAGAAEYLAETWPVPIEIYVSTAFGGSDTTALVTGNADDIEFGYGETAIKMTGRDKSVSLHTQKLNQKFLNQTSSQIVSTIAGMAGLSAAVDATMLQAGKIIELDWARLANDVSIGAFLHKLAQFEGAIWYVKGNTLNFKTQPAGSGGYVVNYVPRDGGTASADFIDLRVRRKPELSQNISVTASGWHSKRKTVVTSKKTASGNGGTLNYSYVAPNIEQDHADQIAAKRAADHARHELTVELDMVGDVGIDIAMGLSLQGTQLFDQSYDIDSIHHQIGDGYSMHIEAKAMKQGRSIS